MNPLPPTSVEANVIAAMQTGDFASAERLAALHLEHEPGLVELRRLCAIAQMQQRNFDAAERSFREALQHDPNHVGLLCNAAALAAARGHSAEAIALFKRALQLAPAHAAALFHLARLHRESGDMVAAADCFARCTHADPEHRHAWQEFADLRIAQRRPADAAGLLRRALALRPDARVAYRLGLVLDETGDWLGAAQAYARAHEIDPDHDAALSQLVWAKRRLCDWNDLEKLSAALVDAVEQRGESTSPFAFLAEPSTPQQQLLCARHLAARLGAAASAIRAEGAGFSLPLRVGFVSSGFAEHATAVLIVELIECLRESGLHTVGFATTPSDGTTTRRRVAAGFHEFHDLGHADEEATAAAIRRARIDVLLDIDGYCAKSKPGIFARRPAPLQVNWLAYPGSLGAPWIDYLIADRVVVPESATHHYSEKIAWLPRCYQPSATSRALVAPPAPAQCGLPPRDGANRAFVYCCFNASYKITPQRFGAWMQILEAVPGSVLWLLDNAPANSVAARLRAAAQAAGIAPERLVFSAKAVHPRYLGYYRHADLFLDTDPVNAHTTANDALWSGCPVLTVPGATFAARVAGSLNHHLGLAEMNVADESAYIDTAIGLARQPQRLLALRNRLMESERRTRLFDARGYAQDFAALITAMAQRARRGEAPAHLRLDATGSATAVSA